MNVTMRLTLDDLVRALRGKAHAMAEDLETRYPRHAPARTGDGQNSAKGERDDVSRA